MSLVEAIYVFGLLVASSIVSLKAIEQHRGLAR